MVIIIFIIIIIWLRFMSTYFSWMTSDCLQFMLQLITFDYYRPLSRRLDRCDRVIQNEGDDSIGGKV